MINLSMEHEMTLKEPWFSLVKNNIKTIEGRIYDEKRKQINIGDTIKFYNKDKSEYLTKVVSNIIIYYPFNIYVNTIDRALREAKLKNILPGITTYKKGVEVYESIPGYKEKIKKYGFVLFYLE